MTSNARALKSYPHLSQRGDNVNNAGRGDRGRLIMLQLSDSAFPTGGFAHSNGLEAAWQQGEVEDLAAWLEQLVWQTGFSALPFVSDAFDEPASLRELDARCEAFLSNLAAKRASRLQGQAFLAACAAAFGEKRLEGWAKRPFHHAPAFGAACAALGLPKREAQRLFLFLGLRGSLSAGVRLGVVGPLEAQRLLAKAAPVLEAALERCAAIGSEDAAQTAPLHDLFQGTQDRLYSRLFQS